MDKYLLDRKVISQEAYDTIADFVHDLMVRGTHDHRPEEMENYPLHHPEVIRYKFSKTKGKIPPHLLTDGLRMAYGHAVIDEHIREDPSMPIDELLKRAYHTFRYRDYEKSVYSTKKRKRGPKWIHR